MTARYAHRILALLVLLAGAPLAAQQGEELMPAVDTSATEQIGPAVDTSPDAYEPAVDTSADEPEATAAVAANDAAPVMDRLTLGRTEITGNQELPKVMYIVPWQKSDPGDLMGRPVNTLLDEVLAPIDREEFIRQVDYYADLNGDNEE